MCFVWVEESLFLDLPVVRWVDFLTKWPSDGGFQEKLPKDGFFLKKRFFFSKSQIDMYIVG